MNNFNIKIINKNSKNNFIFNNNQIIINILNLTNYNIFKLILKINNIIKNYEEIIKINIYFENITDNKIIFKILSWIHNILYKYFTKKIEICNNLYNTFFNELNLYKDICMNPNKNPDIYLEYIKSRIPLNYKYNEFNINKIQSELFPLTRAVGNGSQYNSYFIHIYPEYINKKLKNIFLVGKAVTFDSGGLNLKNRNMADMKIDMIGSAILISVLNLLELEKLDKKYNIHILLPIVENMIGNCAIRPGMTIKTMCNKIVEIGNTDAEGRLCLVDAFDYIKLLKLNNSIILDIATLTGNTINISNGFSSICFSNNLGQKYLNNLIDIGEEIGEYVDTIKIRNEYLDQLESPVANINSINEDCKAGSTLAAAFLQYFIPEDIPWIHMDVASCVFKNNMVLSYGINLLYNFLQLEL